MADEKIYNGFRVVTDDDKEICRLYNTAGDLLMESDEWCFSEWILEKELFYKGYAFIRSFSDEPHRTTICHIEKGIIHLEGVRIINSCLWNDLMWVWRYDNKIGLLGFDLEWVLPPVFDDIEAPDMAMRQPFIRCYQSDVEYIFTMQGRLYPASQHGLAEVLMYDAWYSPGSRIYVQSLLIKERNAAGKWRYIYMEELEEGGFINYETPFAYDSITYNEYDVLSYTEDGVEKECDVPDARAH